MTELEEKIAKIVDGNCYKETCPLSYMRPCSKGCSYTKAQQIKDLIISQGMMICPNPDCIEGRIVDRKTRVMGYTISTNESEDVIDERLIDCSTCHGAGEVPVELKRISPKLMQKLRLDWQDENNMERDDNGKIIPNVLGDLILNTADAQLAAIKPIVAGIIAYYERKLEAK